MPFNFQRGDLTGVAWAPQILGTAVGPVWMQCSVKDQDADMEALLYDVTGTLAGGARARLAGPRDASATVNAIYDADASPYLASPNITEGAGGLLLFWITATVNPARYIQIPMRIAKVHWKSGVETAVMYSFDAKMDSRIGAIVYPAA